MKKERKNKRKKKSKNRKRHRRAPQIRDPATLEEQLPDHVDDEADGPHEYTLVKERKPRSTPKERWKKRGGSRRRMIIDIHLEVINECQKGTLNSTKEDFFEILVQEFMGSEFIKEKKVPSLDSGFREEHSIPKEQVRRSDSGFSEEHFIPEERVPCSDCGFREGKLCFYRRYSEGKYSYGRSS
ncbi:SICA antigen [Plasmodium coatneyi]|uniref:SICA antigen n=1 Tax=Plasmodium coatneyi TaxID=208452 RepID=A0A1B1E7Q1_9APIC|nr:SICA antigen [Plasmodium coatneyi]ANQ11062.1 SICA antigen [Plasmodium coatneyi]